MPQVSQTFSAFPVSVVLNGAGYGTVSFQAVGANVRISNGFARVNTSTLQAVVTVYKNFVSTGSALWNSQSGSTGAPFTGPVDLFDGERLIVEWSGGDPGATATATFTGKQIPFDSSFGETTVTGDPIVVAGDGSLVFPAIKSPNYIAGVTGWKISRDGTVDFASGTFRGDILINGSNGSYVHIYANGAQAEIDLNPPTSGTATFAPGMIRATSTGNTPLVEIIGAYQTSPVLGGAGQINLGADPILNQTAGYLLAQQVVIGDASLGSTLDIQSPSVLFGPDSTDNGRGVVSYIGSTTDSAAIGATETVVLTCPSTTYRAGRCYRVSIGGRVSVSAGPNAPIFNVKKTNTAGQTLNIVGRVGCTNTGQFAIPNNDIVFTCLNDVTAAICLTLTGTASFNAVHNANRWMAITDVTVLNPAYNDAVVLV